MLKTYGKGMERRRHVAKDLVLKHIHIPSYSHPFWLKGLSQSSLQAGQLLEEYDTRMRDRKQAR